MPPPITFLDHLTREGYHPRSNKHSNTLALAIVNDLGLNCEVLALKAQSGLVVYDLNFDLRVKTATWNVDLVIGRPASPSPTKLGAAMDRQSPATIEIAVEIKSVMTEHRKAVKNRKRDLEAHHEHVHNYDQSTIAAGVLVINQSLTFQSPLRSTLTTHAQDARGAASLVSHCLNEMRNIAERSDVAGQGLDAKCAIVLEMDNVNLPTTRYIQRAPAPQTGDPLS